MDKLLSEYRRQLDDFEVVDVANQDTIEELRSKVDVEVPLNLHWTWDYSGTAEEMRRLYEKGKVGQWNAETDLDWVGDEPRSLRACAALQDDGQGRSDAEGCRLR